MTAGPPLAFPAAARNTPAGRPARVRREPQDPRAELAHCRQLLADMRRTLGEVLAALALARAHDRLARSRRANAAHWELIDAEAERIVLAAAFARGKAGGAGLAADDFGLPLHRSIARSLCTDEVGEDLLEPEVRGYGLGLLDRRDGQVEVGIAARRVVRLAKQRRALQIAEGAVAGLRLSDCQVVLTAAELRAAAEVLEGRKPNRSCPE
jgi:hypothetical protein